MFGIAVKAKYLMVIPEFIRLGQRKFIKKYKLSKIIGAQYIDHIFLVYPYIYNYILYST